MTRTILFAITLVGIALAISFSANQNHARNEPDLNTCTAPSVHQDERCKVTALGTTIFNTSELKHYLCALEVKNHRAKEIIITGESAVACTKTVPEYLAEPTCK